MRSGISAGPSDPMLFQIWSELHARYFPQEPALSRYRVIWSRRRQKRVLASCNLQQKVVRVALEMKAPQCAEWLEALLYHEMCHAVLEPHYKSHRLRIPWHGGEFRRLESRHPKIDGLNRWIKEGGWRRAVRSNRGAIRKSSTILD